MKQSFFSLALLLLGHFSFSQDLPVRTVTIFKNGNALIEKAGKVPVTKGSWSTTHLPDALFGTFWIDADNDDLLSVYSHQDSVEEKVLTNDNVDLLKANIGKPVRLWLSNYSQSPAEEVSGTIEKIEGIITRNQSYPIDLTRVYLKTKDGNWITFGGYQVTKMEFLEKPAFGSDSKTVSKKPVETLQVNFKSQKSAQDIRMGYLCNQLGWVPVYNLTLSEKGKSKLALRAEVSNNAEDIDNAELRLAVGVPNFSYANGFDWLVRFGINPGLYSQDDEQMKISYNTGSAQGLKFGRLRSYGDFAGPADSGAEVAGEQVEDYFYYTIKPGPFPKNSRYQYPIFETAVEPTHFYESRLPDAGPNSILAYRNYQTNRTEASKNLVFHFVEFPNPIQMPFTTGLANIFSNSGGKTYPISQDLLPYTPPSAKCKVKIAQSPEIKVTHGEGDVERKENVLPFFSGRYDEIKVEGQVCVVNYKNEPLTLKIKRNIEGTPLESVQPWITTQEQATLRVNSSYEVEWVMDLKPGEEKKWKYSYKVYVDL